MSAVRKVLSATMSLLLSSSLLAQEKFVLGVESLDYFPLWKYDEESGYIGYARDLFDLFAQKADLKIEYRALPVKRLYADFFKAKVLDFKFPDNVYWNQDIRKGLKLTYSKPVLEYIDGVMIKPENKEMKLGKLKILGTMRGFTPWSYLDRIKAGKITLKETNTFHSLLKQTAHKVMDGAYVNITIARYHLNYTMKDPNALVFGESLPHIRDHYYLTTIKYPHIVEAFNQFMLSNKDTIEKLQEKYKVMM